MKQLFTIMALATATLLGSCDKDEKIIEKEVEVKVEKQLTQIDLNIAVPIHKSSLTKFQYVIESTINNDVVTDTVGFIADSIFVHSSNEGSTRADAIIEPETEVIYEFNIVGGRRTVVSDVVYVLKSLTFDRLPIECQTNVNLSVLPEAVADSFEYVIPKPYIFASLYYDNAEPVEAGISLDGKEPIIKSNGTDLAGFLATYGSKYTSTFSITNKNGGMRIKCN